MKAKRNGLAAILIVILVAFALALIGCGGSTPLDNGGNDPGDFECKGTWQGTFADQIPVNGDGTLTMTIANSGAWTAKGHNDKFNTDIKGSGTIDASGNLTGTMTNGKATGTVTGKLSRYNNNLSGAVIISTKDGSDQVNVDLYRT